MAGLPLGLLVAVEVLHAAGSGAVAVEAKRGPLVGIVSHRAASLELMLGGRVRIGAGGAVGLLDGQELSTRWRYVLRLEADVGRSTFVGVWHESNCHRACAGTRFAGSTPNRGYNYLYIGRKL